MTFFLFSAGGSILADNGIETWCLSFASEDIVTLSLKKRGESFQLPQALIRVSSLVARLLLLLSESGIISILVLFTFSASFFLVLLLPLC